MEKIRESNYYIAALKKAGGDLQNTCVIIGQQLFSVTARKGFTNKTGCILPSCIFCSIAICNVVLLGRSGEGRRNEKTFPYRKPTPLASIKVISEAAVKMKDTAPRITQLFDSCSV